MTEQSHILLSEPEMSRKKYCVRITLQIHDDSDDNDDSYDSAGILQSSLNTNKHNSELDQQFPFHSDSLQERSLLTRTCSQSVTQTDRPVSQSVRQTDTEPQSADF